MQPNDNRVKIVFAYFAFEMYMYFKAKIKAT